MRQYIVGAPLERVAIDIMGPLPTSDKGNKYLLVIGDYFTKFIHAIPFRNQEAETVARSFVDNFITIFGVSMQVHTDQGANFESRLFRELCRILDIDKTRTTVMRPQSDGMVERFMRTIVNMLSSFVPLNKLDGLNHKPSADYLHELEQALALVHELARKNMNISCNSQKKLYDHKIHQNHYNVGDPTHLDDSLKKINVLHKENTSMKQKYAELKNSFEQEKLCSQNCKCEADTLKKEVSDLKKLVVPIPRLKTRENGKLVFLDTQIISATVKSVANISKEKAIITPKKHNGVMEDIQKQMTLMKTRWCQNNNTLTDITDGKAYRNIMVEYEKFDGFCLTALFNTDGVTSMLLKKWFSPTNANKEYFIGKSLKTISSRLQHIKPPSSIERLPRDLEKHYKSLKATELQAWLLYYGVPCLFGILPDTYLNHFSNLSEATFILLGDSITTEKLDRAESLLAKFYASFEGLYGSGSCGLNVHNTCVHLIHYVKLWDHFGHGAVLPLKITMLFYYNLYMEQE
ncbi:Hypothetical predicted protein [Mytilus galloprovincialis]|uniref:Integrase catalytic domain-containing protein n=1 Tax=Mytilus galloprovincialis TaxID=29158 RepID=A0A8B6BJT9_MYTGA|nr:Hypothetical predicted protein [Mytilus galloprovincialis]